MQHSTRRRRRVVRMRQWPDGTYAEVKSAKLLAAQIDYSGLDCARIAERADCSRQMISFLKTGRYKSCTPRLAAKIERALDVPPGTLFTVREKSTDGSQADRPQRIAS